MRGTCETRGQVVQNSSNTLNYHKKQYIPPRCMHSAKEDAEVKHWDKPVAQQDCGEGTQEAQVAKEDVKDGQTSCH
jgi:hypothetical protein